MPSLKRRAFLSTLFTMLGLAPIISAPKPSSASSTPSDTDSSPSSEQEWKGWTFHYTNRQLHPLLIEVNGQSYNLLPDQTITVEGLRRPVELRMLTPTAGVVEPTER